jgi:predicted TIM-barrel fold metal-dependent hydrolase
MSERGLRSLGLEAAPVARELLLRWQDRIVFGSDFPNLPYDYEQERRWAWERELPLDVCRKMFNTNARIFLDLDRAPSVGV